MKTWVENRPGRPGGSDFRTDDIELGPPLAEETRQAAATYVRSRATDATDAHNLLSMLGLEEEDE